MSIISTPHEREWAVWADSAPFDSKTQNQLIGESVIEASSADAFEPSSRSSDVVVSPSDPCRFPVDISRPIPLVEPGITLGTFRIERRLGRGGMGEVWLAREQLSEHRVAIKILHDGVIHHSEDFDSVKAMFQRLHVLEHQNICPLQLLGNDPRFGYYLVMKYVEGVDLSAYRRKQMELFGEFPLFDAVRVLAPVARALDYAHGQRISHCDVKPQNIMVSQDGMAVQIVDFCLAAEIRTTVHGRKNSPINHGGTRSYMSPEQWLGEPLDGRTDQYSLSVVAYELLAGRPPVQSNDPEFLRRCVLNEAPPPINGVGIDVNSVLRRGLAKSIHDRFDTCTALVNALDTAIGRGHSLGLPTAASMSSNARADRRESHPQSSTPVEKESNLELVDDDASNENINTLEKRTAEIRPRQRTGKLRDRISESRSPGKIEARRYEEDHHHIREIHRNATVWLWILGGIFLVALIMIVCFAIIFLLARSNAKNYSPEQQQENAQPLHSESQNHKSNSTAVQSSLESSHPPIASKDATSLPPLSYRWKDDQVYVYTVNIDVDDGQNHILNTAGKLFYWVDRQESSTVFSIYCEGTLNRKHHRREADANDLQDVNSWIAPLQYSINRLLADADHVETDAFGTIHSIVGHGELPEYLGASTQLLIETLPTKNEDHWSITRNFRLNDHRENINQSSPLHGPNVVIPAAPQMLIPRNFGGPFTDRTPTDFPVSIQVDYSLGQKQGDAQTLHKTVELNSEEMIGSQPRLLLKGKGDLQFNLTAGIPANLTFQATLTETSSNSSKSTAIILRYQFAEDYALPANGKSILPAPLSNPGAPVTAESKVEVGDKLVGEWAGKWQLLKVIKLNEDGTVRIHWEGWSDTWDEDVSRSRLRLLGN